MAISPKTTVRGTLNLAKYRLQWATISSALTVEPGFTSTNAHGVSPHFVSGFATTAQASTAGWRRSTSSTSIEETFSPPEMMTSASGLKNAKPPGHLQGVAELLAVQQRAHLRVGRSHDADAFLLGLVARQRWWHGATSAGNGRCGGAQVRVRACLRPWVDKHRRARNHGLHGAPGMRTKTATTGLQQPVLGGGPVVLHAALPG